MTPPPKPYRIKINNNMKFDKLTEAYMNVVAKQIKMHFANIKQIEDFLLKQNDGNLDKV